MRCLSHCRSLLCRRAFVLGSPLFPTIPAYDALWRCNLEIALILCPGQYSGPSLQIPAFAPQPEYICGKTPRVPSPQFHNPLISGCPLLPCSCSNPPRPPLTRRELPRRPPRQRFPQPSNRRAGSLDNS